MTFKSKIFNSTTTWGWPAKALHWIGAAIILVLLVHGWWMTHMTPRPDRLTNYAWHSALGYDLLALIVLPAVVAMVQSGTGIACRSQAVGAHGRASWARVPLRSHVHRVVDRLDGRHDVSRSHDRGPVRNQRAADRHGGRSLGASVDRGIAHDPRLRAGRGRGDHVIGALRHHIVKRNDVMRRMTWGMPV
jgi:Prokaryotic cytochrome b561